MSMNLAAVGTEGAKVTSSWTSKDCLLYALGVGAGNPDPLDELAFTTENSIGVTQRALPTFPIVIGSLDSSLMNKLGDYNKAMLVHAEQEIELHQSVPVEGTATGTPAAMRTRRSVLVRPCPRTITAISDHGTWASRCACRSSAAISPASCEVARRRRTSARPPGRTRSSSRWAPPPAAPIRRVTRWATERRACGCR